MGNENTTEEMKKAMEERMIFGDGEDFFKSNTITEEGAVVEHAPLEKGCGDGTGPRGGNPKTEEERKKTHKKKYGNEDTPPRGTGQKKKGAIVQQAAPMGGGYKSDDDAAAFDLIKSSGLTKKTVEAAVKAVDDCVRAMVKAKGLFGVEGYYGGNGPLKKWSEARREIASCVNGILSSERYEKEAKKRKKMMDSGMGMYGESGSERVELDKSLGDDPNADLLKANEALRETLETESRPFEKAGQSPAGGRPGMEWVKPVPGKRKGFWRKSRGKGTGGSAKKDYKADFESAKQKWVEARRKFESVSPSDPNYRKLKVAVQDALSVVNRAESAYSINVLQPSKKGAPSSGGAKPAEQKVTYHKPKLSTEGRDLRLFIDNDSDLFRQQTNPIYTNLKKKLAKGVYDHTKAAKLFMYLVDNGARKYVKEAGSGSVRDMFPKAERTKVAQAMADSFHKEYTTYAGAIERQAVSKSDGVLEGLVRSSSLLKAHMAKG